MKPTSPRHPECSRRRAAPCTRSHPRPRELAQVAAHQPRLHVLKRDARVDEVEVFIGKQRQVRRTVDVIGRPLFGVQTPRRFDHVLRDVDAVHFRERRGERLSQSPHAATEVQRSTRPELRSALAGPSQRSVDLGPTGAKKLVEIPTVAALVIQSQDRPQRIPCSELIPVAGEATQTHNPK